MANEIEFTQSDLDLIELALSDLHQTMMDNQTDGDDSPATGDLIDKLEELHYRFPFILGHDID